MTTMLTPPLLKISDEVRDLAVALEGQGTITAEQARALRAISSQVLSQQRRISSFIANLKCIVRETDEPQCCGVPVTDSSGDVACCGDAVTGFARVQSWAQSMLDQDEALQRGGR